VTSQPKILKFSREVKQHAENLGIRDIEIRRLRDHPLLLGSFNGRRISLVMPSKIKSDRDRDNFFALLRRTVREAR